MFFILFALYFLQLFLHLCSIYLISYSFSLNLIYNIISVRIVLFEFTLKIQVF